MNYGIRIDLQKLNNAFLRNFTGKTATKRYYKSVIEENERMRQELEDRKTSEKDELIKQLRAKVKALNIRLTNYGLSTRKNISLRATLLS